MKVYFFYQLILNTSQLSKLNFICFSFIILKLTFYGQLILFFKFKFLLKMLIINNFFYKIRYLQI